MSILLEMSVLLEGTQKSVELVTAEQPSLIPEMRPSQGALEMVNIYGILDVDEPLCARASGSSWCERSPDSTDFSTGN